MNTRAQAEYEAARLRRWADRLLGISFDHYRNTAPRRRLPELCLTDAERFELATHLRRVAANSAVVTAILKIGRRAGRRPTPGRAARRWKIALDYQLTKKRLGKGRSKAAVIEVGNAWNGADAVTAVNGAWNSVGKRILEAYSECRELGAWVDWASYEIDKFEAGHPDMNGRQILEALSKSLRQSA